MLTGAQIKQKRMALRFNQRQFAKLLGKSAETLCRMEAQGSKSPMLSLLFALLEADEANVQRALVHRHEPHA
jgi:transcriptional regulator with XRE-family HTH domain